MNYNNLFGSMQETLLMYVSDMVEDENRFYDVWKQNTLSLFTAPCVHLSKVYYNLEIRI